jgi:hypothetical protein
VPRAFALPNLSELRLMMSKTVVILSWGRSMRPSFAFGCLRGIVSPSTGLELGTSTLKGGPGRQLVISN